MSETTWGVCVRCGTDKVKDIHGAICPTCNPIPPTPAEGETEALEQFVTSELREFLCAVNGEDRFIKPAMKMTAPYFVERIVSRLRASRSEQGERIEGWIAGDPHETGPFFGCEDYITQIRDKVRPATLILRDPPDSEEAE